MDSGVLNAVRASINIVSVLLALLTVPGAWRNRTRRVRELLAFRILCVAFVYALFVLIVAPYGCLTPPVGLAIAAGIAIATRYSDADWRQDRRVGLAIGVCFIGLMAMSRF